MRFFIEVTYEGTAFHGSQIQGAIPTVQLTLNKAISTLLRENVETFGASRTDAGVHALQSYYHFDLGHELPAEFRYHLNALLPFEIAVTRILRPLDEINANARFDAIARQYRYRLHKNKNPFLQNRSYYYPYTLNHELLTETAKFLPGKHDFTSFSKRNTQSFTFICTVEFARWTFEKDEFFFEVRANRFLRGMVRALVGTQLRVARGRMTLAEFKNLFEELDCRKADFSVPGHGLYLEKIDYPDPYFVEANKD